MISWSFFFSTDRGLGIIHSSLSLLPPRLNLVVSSNSAMRNDRLLESYLMSFSPDSSVRRDLLLHGVIAYVPRHCRPIRESCSRQAACGHWHGASSPAHRTWKAPKPPYLSDRFTFSCLRQHFLFKFVGRLSFNLQVIQPYAWFSLVHQRRLRCAWNVTALSDANSLDELTPSSLSVVIFLFFVVTATSFLLISTMVLLPRGNRPLLPILPSPVVVADHHLSM